MGNTARRPRATIVKSNKTDRLRGIVRRHGKRRVQSWYYLGIDYASPVSLRAFVGVHGAAHGWQDERRELADQRYI